MTARTFHDKAVRRTGASGWPLGSKQQKLLITGSLRHGLQEMPYIFYISLASLSLGIGSVNQVSEQSWELANGE